MLEFFEYAHDGLAIIAFFTWVLFSIALGALLWIVAEHSECKTRIAMLIVSIVILFWIAVCCTTGAAYGM